MPPWLFHYVLIPGKNIQFDIMVLLEVQEINLQGDMRAVNVMNIVYFYENFFPFDPVAFFSEIFLPQLPVLVSNMQL